MNTIESHPSRLVLELLSVGEAPPEGREAVAAHVQGCAGCRAYLDELAATRAERLERQPPRVFAAVVAARAERDAVSAVPRLRAFRPWLAGGLAGAVVAALAVFVFVPALDRSRSPIETEAPPAARRFRGDAAVTIHVRRGGDTFVLGEGDRPRAGDALRFELRLPAPEHGALYAIEPTGVVQTLLPARGDGPLPLSGTALLPGSVSVTGDGTASLLVLVLRPASFDVRAVRAELATAVRARGFEAFDGADVEGVRQVVAIPGQGPP